MTSVIHTPQALLANLPRSEFHEILEYIREIRSIGNEIHEALLPRCEPNLECARHAGEVVKQHMRNAGSDDLAARLQHALRVKSWVDDINEPMIAPYTQIVRDIKRGLEHLSSWRYHARSNLAREGVLSQEQLEVLFKFIASELRRAEKALQPLVELIGARRELLMDTSRGEIADDYFNELGLEYDLVMGVHEDDDDYSFLDDLPDLGIPPLASAPNPLDPHAPSLEPLLALLTPLKPLQTMFHSQNIPAHRTSR